MVVWSAITTGVSTWIRSQWRGSSACYAAGEEPELLPTCFAVLAEEMLGTLEGWDGDRRRQVAERILLAQDPETGLFALPDICNEELLWPHGCDLLYVRYQVAYFALAALSALHRKPRYPLAFAEPWLDRQYALGWIEGGPWHDPWNHSNRIMFLLRCLVHLGTDWNREKAWSCYDAVVEHLLRLQDPRTGLWHGVATCDVRTAVYAAYHFFPFMFWRGIAPPYADRIIESALSMQHADGLFGSQPGGGACEDLDAIDVLVKFSSICDHRATDVKRALTRAFRRILELQNPDGGFPNYLPQPVPRGGGSWKRRLARTVGLGALVDRLRGYQETSYYSGWRRVKSRKGASDMWAAWFRPLALSLIVSRYPELVDVPAAPRFHGLPGLGWHDVERIRAARGWVTRV